MKRAAEIKFDLVTVELQQQRAAFRRLTIIFKDNRALPMASGLGSAWKLAFSP
jgi:hypothetical protein